MALVVVRRADHRVMPWRNGGGTTREIAVSPSSGPFAWRLSIATVATPGPFSTFDGCDRVIMVLDGAGMVLTVDGVARRIDRRHAPFAFAGEAAVTCDLIDGPIHDFNVIVDRARHRANVEILETGRSPRLPAHDGVRAIVCLEGHAALSPGPRLEPWDTAIQDPAEPLDLTGRVAVVTIAGVSAP